MLFRSTFASIFFNNNHFVVKNRVDVSTRIFNFKRHNNYIHRKDSIDYFLPTT
ncbi:hypothetical protein H206_05500 [Candidatus Electrothrix aarhusensis]|uniref:Uncharacterized protein n=1 Tax=Candidatus Electrothrix aarhusensis TaxID=1859131 RepID=A0A3S3UBA4_9BACT|nr:hypothetical protein H206_05500 [Candidatus Electrothrix aarhusensis]